MFERICNAGRFSEDEVLISISIISQCLSFTFLLYMLKMCGFFVGSGSLLFSTTYIWSQLLPCNGI